MYHVSISMMSLSMKRVFNQCVWALGLLMIYITKKASTTSCLMRYYLRAQISLIKKVRYFVKNSYKYVQGKEELFVVLEEPRDRSTRAPTFSIDEAKEACDSYIKILWECI